MKLIDISGFGHSGKTAVTDLLREVDGVHAHQNSFEFNLIRLPDGILDLSSALTDNWSPSRSDFAIKRFRLLALSLNTSYSEILNRNFMNITDEYLDSLIEGKLNIGAWYDGLYSKPGYIERSKPLLKKVRVFKLLKAIYRIFWSIEKTYQNKVEVNLASGDSFLEKTIEYLEKVLSYNLEDALTTIVTNNAFEPFNPNVSLKYFKDAYSIIVDRDPRDIFISVIKSNFAFTPYFEEGNKSFKAHYQTLKEDMLGVNDINIFIKRQKLYREKTEKASYGRKIIYIKYEDLVLNYKSTKDKIFSIIGINPKLHLNKNKYFDPKESRLNVKIYKRFGDRSEIKMIEKELKPYLYE